MIVGGNFWHADNLPSRNVAGWIKTGDDADNDGVADTLDNCPALIDASQTDGDGDGRGDVCDNCPSLANTGQDDYDFDLIGDSCDNCPTVWYNYQ